MIPGLLGTLSGGFRPMDFGGCVTWLDAPQIVGLSDGNAVSPWTDLSGQGHSFSQGTPGYKPTYQTSEINGLPVVQFDNADDYLSTSDFYPFNDEYTLFIVLRPDNVDGGWHTVLSQGSGTTRPLFFCVNGGFGAPVNSLSALHEGNGSTYGHAGAVTQATSYVVCFGRTASSHFHYQNGVYGTVGGSVYDTNSADPLLIGIYNLAAYPFGGVIGEIIIYDSDLATTPRQSVEKYLGQKWGITLDQSPVNTVAPALSAAGWTVGQVASCDTGTWTNEPTTYTYQWQRKDGGYTNIPGATSSSYLLAAADSGKNVRCGVTPSNAFATGTVAYSLDSDLIL